MRSSLGGEPLARPPAPPAEVLPQDEEHIGRFNETAASSHRVRLELLPEPFLGNPQAPVVLLGLNPGFKQEAVRTHQEDRYFIQSVRRNLAHERAEPRRTPKSGQWWSPETRPVVRASSRR